MGICESDMNSKSLDNIPVTKNKNSNRNQNSKIISLKGNLQNISDLNISKNLSDSNAKGKISKSNFHLNLQKYEPSLPKTSELSNSNLSKSELDSNTNDDEIIIHGQINVNYQNKETDFDNKSFMNLIKSEGGIVLKDENQIKLNSNKKKENEILCDLDKDDISEIKSKTSLGDMSHSKDTILSALNGKKIKNEMPKETNKEIFNNYYLINNNLNQGNNIDNNYNRSKYSTFTSRPKINFNKYLNGIFANEYNTQQNNNYIQNGQINIYNKQTLNTPLDINDKPLYKNKYPNSLISNYNNKSNYTMREELAGSFVSVPKNDEILPEIFFNMNINKEEIISNISSY